MTQPRPLREDDTLGRATSLAVDERVQPGESLDHFCATHLQDHECAADPGACVAFCGYDFKGDSSWSAADDADCVVCEAMIEARGDFDLPLCECAVCVAIADA